MAASGDDFRLVFWVAVVPAVVSVLFIVWGVQEPETLEVVHRRRSPIHRDELRRLPVSYWLVIAFAAALSLARFSEAFLLLRASDLGLTATWVPLVLIVMNVVYAASAWPFGHWSDRGDRHRLLALGIVLLITADVVLALATSVGWVLAGTVLWGLHMGATQGLLATLVADAAPADLRGTAFGLFNLMTGLALLLASFLAGALWTAAGPVMTFAAGAGFSLLALVGLVVVSRRTRAAAA